MNIVSYDTAKVTVLFPFEEVAPLGTAPGLSVISRVTDRYKFRTSPDLSKPQAEIAKNGIKFENGIFDSKGDVVSIIDFTIFTDGVVVTAPTTEQSELFWNDIISWMIEENGFRPFGEEPVRRFVSQLVVEFDKPLKNLIKPFEALASLISDQLSYVYDHKVSVDFSRLDLEYDKLSDKSSITVPKFIIERRQGVAFSKERYYCSAPIATKHHIAILEKIEKNLL